MKKEQRSRIINRHRDSLTRHGYHPNALYWSSREIQEIRFQVLSDIGITTDDSVLDVGCGFADFNRWSSEQGRLLHYTGIDLSPDLIQVAAEKHPGAELLCGELGDFDFEPMSFDWVVLSGAMNEQLHDQGDYARRQIAAMLNYCRKGCAFNMLDARHLNAHDLQSVDPFEMLAYCQDLCPDSALVDGYLNNDFTIYMRR